jgi:hypothetical protein
MNVDGAVASLPVWGFFLKEGLKLNLPPKLVEKLVWVPVISFCKISFPNNTFDGLT